MALGLGLNEDSLISNVIDKPIKNQKFVVVSWKQLEDKPVDKPTIEVLSEAIENENEGKVKSSYYPLYGKARFRIRNFLIALGFYKTAKKTKKDGTEYEYKHCTEDEMNSLDEILGMLYTADIEEKITSSNNKILEIVNEREC